MEWRLLQGVPEEEVRRLLQVARRRSFRRGEVVFHRDDPADSLHLIVKGRFAIRVMTPLGEQATIAVRGPGESFGEMALVGQGARRSATVEALEEAETFCVYEGEFQRLRREHPEVNELVIGFLANEVRMLNERLLEALYVPVERRVLRRLTPGRFQRVSTCAEPVMLRTAATPHGRERATLSRSATIKTVSDPQATDARQARVVSVAHKCEQREDLRDRVSRGAGTRMAM